MDLLEFKANARRKRIHPAIFGHEPKSLRAMMQANRCRPARAGRRERHLEHPVDQQLLAGTFELDFDLRNLCRIRESEAERRRRRNALVPGKSMPARSQQAIEFPM